MQDNTGTIMVKVTWRYSRILRGLRFMISRLAIRVRRRQWVRFASC